MALEDIECQDKIDRIRLTNKFGVVPNAGSCVILHGR